MNPTQELDLVCTLEALGLSAGDSPPDSITVDVDGSPLTFVGGGAVVDSQDRVLYWSYWLEEPADDDAPDPLHHIQVTATG